MFAPPTAAVSIVSSSFRKSRLAAAEQEGMDGEAELARLDALASRRLADSDPDSSSEGERSPAGLRTADEEETSRLEALLGDVQC